MADFKLLPKHKDQALSSIGELKGETVFLVCKNTESTIRIKDQGTVVWGSGGLGEAAQWKVKKLDGMEKYQGEKVPVVGFCNVKWNKWLAIRQGELCLGSGGEHCEFMVVQKAKATLLIKHNNHNVKIGFKPNGEPKTPKEVGEGPAARIFIFDVKDVKGKWLD